MTPLEAGGNTTIFGTAAKGCSRCGRTWKIGCRPILENGIRSEIGGADMCVFRDATFTSVTGSLKCRLQLAGRGRMPCGEEHRKAVCGKTARTV